MPARLPCHSGQLDSTVISWYENGARGKDEGENASLSIAIFNGSNPISLAPTQSTATGLKPATRQPAS